LKGLGIDLPDYDVFIEGCSDAKTEDE